MARINGGDAVVVNVDNVVNISVSRAEAARRSLPNFKLLGLIYQRDQSNQHYPCFANSRLRSFHSCKMSSLGMMLPFSLGM